MMTTVYQSILLIFSRIEHMRAGMTPKCDSLQPGCQKDHPKMYKARTVNNSVVATGSGNCFYRQKINACVNMK
ncbi:hypothetical protein EHN46_21735 [Salmonella enterica]|nr:hypothetical protein [Salmonella enterica]EBK3282616.1 hypothetical protein [Salmonella enterica]ECI6680407.1 hypothetical protein [Salmonella enterica subsp. enterica]